jgi:hypothetical protein
VPTRCTRDEAGRQSTSRCTPLVRALALHGVSENSGSHLGSTLNPGGAVLTLGVSRRSRSVAYIRADASPSEVLAPAIVPPRTAVVKLTVRVFAVLCPLHSSLEVRCRRSAALFRCSWTSLDGGGTSSPTMCALRLRSLTFVVHHPKRRVLNQSPFKFCVIRTT